VAAVPAFTAAQVLNHAYDIRIAARRVQKLIAAEATSADGRPADTFQ